MSLMARHEPPDAIAPGDVRVRRLGEPFRVTEIPGCPGVLWQGCIYPDGRLRPVDVEKLRPLPDAGGEADA